MISNLILGGLEDKNKTPEKKTNWVKNPFEGSGKVDNPFSKVKEMVKQVLNGGLGTSFRQEAVARG